MSYSTIYGLLLNKTYIYSVRCYFNKFVETVTDGNFILQKIKRKEMGKNVQKRDIRIHNHEIKASS